MKDTEGVTRRQFVVSSGLSALAAPTTSSASTLGRQGRPAPSGLTTDLAAKTNDNAVACLSSTEMVTGAAPFSTPLTAPIQDRGGQVFNVKAYGAKGDGTTDDKAAIQAAINAAKAAGGGVVNFPPGTFMVSGPLVLPRTGNPPTNVVRLCGAGPRLSRIWGTGAFPANRAIIEWEVTRSQCWHQSITDLWLSLPLVTGTSAIHYKLSALPTSYNDLAAEKGQFELRRLLIESNCYYHAYMIYLEGGHYDSHIEDIYGDSGNQNLDLINYDTLVLKTDYTPYHLGDDIPGLFNTTLCNIDTTVRRGGWARAFEGRLVRSNFADCVCIGGRTGPCFAFYNSYATHLSNLSNEGQSEAIQILFSGCSQMIVDDLGLGTPGPVYPTWQASNAYNVGDTCCPTNLVTNNHCFRCTIAGTSGNTKPVWPTSSGATITDGSVTWKEQGLAIGNGMVLQSTSDCVFRGLYTQQGKPSFSSYGVKVLVVDANSFRNSFHNWLIIGGPATEISFPPAANANYGEFYDIAGGQQWSLGPTTVGRLTATDALTTKTISGTPSDASFTAAPADGTIVVDNTGGFLYFRAGGSWIKLARA